MGLFKVLFSFVLANTLSLVCGLMAILIIVLQYIINPFGRPWARKLRLEPPECLQHPKYGTRKYIKVNNVILHYVESGDPSKPLMLFLHGFPEFWYSWRHQIVEFNKDYWCIAIDMRGYGDSEKPEGQSAYKMEIMIEDIRELLRSLEREKCILIAHDWGSLIACKFRDVYPSNVNALVILGGSSKEAWAEAVESNLEQFKKSWYVFLLRLPWLPEMLLEMNNMNWMEKIFIIKGKDTVTLQDIECYKYSFGKPDAFTPPINYYRANFSYGTRMKKQKCELSVPFLALHAENDAFITAKNLEILKELYASIETIIIKDCSHFFNEQEPEKVNNAIRNFLSKYKF